MMEVGPTASTAWWREVSMGVQGKRIDEGDKRRAIRMIESNVPQRQIARETGLAIETVRKIKQEHEQGSEEHER